MGTVNKLAERVQNRLEEILPQLRKTVTRKLSLAVGAMLEGQTPNTVELSNLLPLPTERQDMREQWLRRLLKNSLLNCTAVMTPFATRELSKAGQNRQTILLCLDQSDLGNRMALLIISVRVGGRALPLAWQAQTGAANLGFEAQKELLECVLSWLPTDAEVLLLADRFYPSLGLFEWLHSHGWKYRLRLKGNVLADPGFGDETTTRDLARGMTERFLPKVRLFASGVMTNLGILHEAGHLEPWIIAMDCYPSRAAVIDYRERWGIEPMFADFKTRGFELGDSQLRQSDRLERLVLIMVLSMYWCVQIGRDDATQNPTPLEKKAHHQTDPKHWIFRKLQRSLVSWFKRGLRFIMRCLQQNRPVPPFFRC